jgi:methylated-DNA-[protein]-cysteine S-methyltransferase
MTKPAAMIGRVAIANYAEVDRMTETGVLTDVIKTDFGWVGLAVSERGVRELMLPLPTEAEARMKLTGPSHATPAVVALRDRLAQAITAYYAGEAIDFDDFPVDLGSTPFIDAVRSTVRAIPRGEVRSYGEVAAKVGHPGAARAVGQVMAKNPVTVIIPCHRVVGSSGRLTGFGGGLPMKQQMLSMEGVSLTAAGLVPLR